ncbi:UDP-N-acetylmuramoyl-tripeptide--D-alanyl-D-alanine ligase [Natranaerovirga pectinivora]|uniref:UDP-N-acetylmuramoyl-tripeptide--D-alanyl-D-alanine ligase n=1 Tax=Natranaerovirga pectinivora TaxID=682400 RepID=A0A4R3MPZ0_9FIRM|nr:UDP-N-acetylmuramoyl-tripeptide--D-alanyl-D-alanine ligase [Natranaerovirga pectinivora]TCT16854.1 UDP-N-acetylmuramoyl-tripeptide--D-alanyl-D-alanine ligase [Natranaerovirga pectinivora]
MFCQDILKIVEILDGKIIRKELVNGDKIKGVSIDSRNIIPGQLFIPIKGENFDGHDYIKAAMDNGALISLTSDEEKMPPNVSGILVKDTQEALVKLAKYYRSTFEIPFIGITGSVGKTSCKEMIASVLSTRFKVHKTKGNYNNDIGLPLTILDMDVDTEISILEMGMNHFNEIDFLGEIALPDYAVITNIGLSHIENLGSQEGILRAKSEIINHLSPDGLLLLNGDDEFLRTLEGKVSQEITFFGFNKTNEYFVKNYEALGLEGVKATIQSPTETYNINLNTLGKHMLYHTLSAIIIGERLSLIKEEIEKGISQYENEKMRLNIVKLENGITIINDSYNASVDSMKAAIDILDHSKTEGRSVAILGDMFEMGAFSKGAHEDVGKYIASKSIDMLICVGEDSRWMYEGAFAHGYKGNLLYYKTKDGLNDAMKDVLKHKDLILVKASRGMKLEDTIEKIKEVSINEF